MNPRKKLVYIIIIAVCLLGSVIVLLWGTGFGGGDDAADVTLINPTSTTPTTDTVAPTGGTRPATGGVYLPPQVFPINTKLETAVLDSSDFQVLQPYDQLQLGEGELGKDDLFAQ